MTVTDHQDNTYVATEAHASYRELRGLIPKMELPEGDVFHQDWLIDAIMDALYTVEKGKTVAHSADKDADGYHFYDILPDRFIELVNKLRRVHAKMLRKLMCTNSFWE